MFGKGVLKIIGLAMAGAIALAGGAQLLSSVVYIIIALRSGDIAPFALAIGTTLALIQMKRLLANNTLSAIIAILAYAASGYIAVVVFVGLLPFGLISSLVGASLTVMGCSVMYDPSQLNDWMSMLATNVSFSWIRRGSSSSELPPILEISHQLVLLPSDSIENIVALMRDRPLLPISLTHFNECNVLFIDTVSQKTSSLQVRDILTQMNIPIGSDASPLLREAIIKIPLIDEQHGLAMTEYRLAIEHGTVAQLIRNAPSRMIVFPSRSGPRVIYPESAAPGLISQMVPENEILNVLLLHKYAGLEEVNNTHANAT